MDKDIKSVKCIECGKEVKMEIPYLWSLNAKQIKIRCPECGHIYKIETKRNDNFDFQSIAGMNIDVLWWLFMWNFIGVMRYFQLKFCCPECIPIWIKMTLGISALWFVFIPMTRYLYKKKVMKIYLQYISRAQGD